MQSQQGQQGAGRLPQYGAGNSAQQRPLGAQPNAGWGALQSGLSMQQPQPQTQPAPSSQGGGLTKFSVSQRAQNTRDSDYGAAGGVVGLTELAPASSYGLSVQQRPGQAWPGLNHQASATAGLHQPHQPAASLHGHGSAAAAQMGSGPTDHGSNFNPFSSLAAMNAHISGSGYAMAAQLLLQQQQQQQQVAPISSYTGGGGAAPFEATFSSSSTAWQEAGNRLAPWQQRFQHQQPSAQQTPGSALHGSHPQQQQQQQQFLASSFSQQLSSFAVIGAIHPAGASAAPPQAPPTYHPTSAAAPYQQQAVGAGAGFGAVVGAASSSAATEATRGPGGAASTSAAAAAMSRNLTRFEPNAATSGGNDRYAHLASGASSGQAASSNTLSAPSDASAAWPVSQSKASSRFTAAGATAFSSALPAAQQVSFASATQASAYDGRAAAVSASAGAALQSGGMYSQQQQQQQGTLAGRTPAPAAGPASAHQATAAAPGASLGARAFGFLSMGPPTTAAASFFPAAATAAVAVVGIASIPTATVPGGGPRARAFNEHPPQQQQQQQQRYAAAPHTAQDAPFDPPAASQRQLPPPQAAPAPSSSSWRPPSPTNSSIVSGSVARQQRFGDQEPRESATRQCGGLSGVGDGSSGRIVRGGDSRFVDGGEARFADSKVYPRRGGRGGGGGGPRGRFAHPADGMRREGGSDDFLPRRATSRSRSRSRSPRPLPRGADKGVVGSSPGAAGRVAAGGYAQRAESRSPLRSGEGDGGARGAERLRHEASVSTRTGAPRGLADEPTSSPAVDSRRDDAGGSGARAAAAAELRARAGSKLPAASGPTAATTLTAIPSFPVTLVERGYSDIRGRHPRMCIPSDFLRSVSNWVLTLPLRRRALGLEMRRFGSGPHAVGMELPSLIPLPAPPAFQLQSAQPQAKDKPKRPSDAAAKTRPAFGPPDLDACEEEAEDLAASYDAALGINLLAPLAIIVDSKRAFLAPAAAAPPMAVPATSASTPGPGLASTLRSPAAAGSLPLRFNVRVLLLSHSPPQGTDSPCLSVERSVKALVHDRRGAIGLLGGSWNADLDGGDPLVEDASLVRAGVRWVAAQAGIDLSPCRAWARLLEVQYHRPAEVIRGKAYAEQVETTVVLLCLDAHRAASRYAASGPGGTWRALDDKERDEGGPAACGAACDGDASRPAGDHAAEPIPTSREGLMKLKYDELRIVARERGLGTKGGKEVLVEAIVQHQGTAAPPNEAQGAAVVPAPAAADAGATVPVSAPAAEVAPSKAEPPAVPAPTAVATTAVDGPAVSAAPPPPLPPQVLTLLAMPPEAAPASSVLSPGPAAGAGSPTSPTPAAGGMRLKLVSLAGLLDYVLSDAEERTFEVSLAAEALHEMLVRDYGHVLAVALSDHATRKKEAAAALASREKGATVAAPIAPSGAHEPAAAASGTDGVALSTPPTVHPELASAWQFFDGGAAGGLPAADVESILINCGLFVSPATVKALAALITSPSTRRCTPLLLRQETTEALGVASC